MIADEAHQRLLAGTGPRPARRAAGGAPRRAPATRRRRPRTTATTPTTRSPSPTPRAPRGCRRRSCTRNASLFAAIRRLRLKRRAAARRDAQLSVLPAAHAAGIITFNQALCNRYELLFLSNQGGAFERSGEVVIDAIERWRPTGVFGFAVTWAELARYDLASATSARWRIWFNTGDCAHEAHIRQLVAVGSHNVAHPRRRRRVPGSKFIDGIGSSEMGHSASRSPTSRARTATGAASASRTTSRRSRCWTSTPASRGAGRRGRPLSGSSRRPSRRATGTTRSTPTAPGIAGYYLTGDLMYRDDDGYYYHVDRAVDAVDLGRRQLALHRHDRGARSSRLPGRARLHRGRRRAGRPRWSPTSCCCWTPGADPERRPRRRRPGGAGRAAARRRCGRS